MDVKIFIDNYREAFGSDAGLPVVFWYSAEQLYPAEPIGGCFFKILGEVRNGRPVSLGRDNIGCGGGKLYAGFADMPPHVPDFVSFKERYKKTPEMVVEYVERIGMPRMDGLYLHLARIDQADSFEGKEGLIFFATPDILSGLATWAFYDSNDADAVVSSFGSGCSTVISQPLVENRRDGKRCFIGLFDPSVRPLFAPDELSFTIPLSRFREMYATMRESCLFGTHAWDKVRKRITQSRSVST